MSLTREEEQYWMLRVVDNLFETVEVGEQQMSALVSSKTTAETNHQRVRIDALENAHYLCGVALVAEPLRRELITDVLHELLLQGHTCLPDFLIGYIVYSVPNLLVALIRHESRVEVLIVEMTPLRSAPCREVHTIGDVAHMVFLRIVAASTEERTSSG